MHTKAAQGGVLLPVHEFAWKRSGYGSGAVKQEVVFSPKEFSATFTGIASRGALQNLGTDIRHVIKESPGGL